MFIQSKYNVMYSRSMLSSGYVNLNMVGLNSKVFVTVKIIFMFSEELVCEHRLLFNMNDYG